MDHAHSPVLHGRDWAVAAWTIVVMAMVLGIVSNQTSLWFSSDSDFHQHSLTSAAQEMATVERLARPNHDTFPAVLTVPFAVTRTQRAVVARAKHRADLAHRDEQPRKEGHTGLLTGLAILGASQSSSN